MNNQQNRNKNSNGYIQPWSNAGLKTQKFNQLRRAKEMTTIAAIFSTIWLICIIIFIILMSSTLALNNTSVKNSYDTGYGMGIASIVFIIIGIFALISGFVISIIASTKIFSASNTQNMAVNNPNLNHHNNGLAAPKILSVVGIILFGWGIGTVILWIVAHQLSSAIKNKIE